MYRGVLLVVAKSKRKKPVGYDSKFEKELHQGPLKHCHYHEGPKIDYVVCSYYEPDFTYEDYIIEAKGRFRDRKEAAKYIAVREQLIFQELVFVFYNPKTPMPGAQKRKNGTKLTHGEWADINGFRWFTKETVKELFNA